MSGRAQASFESATMRAGLERYDRGGTASAQERVKAGGGARRRRWLSGNIDEGGSFRHSAADNGENDRRRPMTLPMTMKIFSDYV